jgi:hypothetical protein
MNFRVEETEHGFDVWVSRTYDSDATLDLSELVELRAVIDRALMDYLARSVARFTAPQTGSEP